MPTFGQTTLSEPLGLLLLPVELEEFELAEHARGLLAIPRVLALEPSRHRTPRVLREVVPARQARRLRLPGQPRVVVLYHPAQYPLARALGARHEQAELWYLRANVRAEPHRVGLREAELADLDQLAAHRARQTRLIRDDEDLATAEQALRERLRQFEIISHRPFIPRGRVQHR